MKKTLIIGNIIEGVTLVGPFPSDDDAIDFADAHVSDENWVLSSTYSPKEYEAL